MKKLKELFIFTIFFEEPYIYIYIYKYFFCVSCSVVKIGFIFTPFIIIVLFRYWYQFSSLSGVSILGRAIVAIAGSG